MGVKIDVQECLRDSPKFRSLLEQEEKSVDQLEQKLEKIVKICSSMIEAGKTYVGQQSLFANGLWELSEHFREDPDVLSALNKLIHNLQEMNKFHTTLLDQASRTIFKNFSSFIKNDFKAVKDFKHQFEKISNEYDNVLQRNSHVPRSKVQEAIDMQNLVGAVRSTFGHKSLDYVNSIFVLQTKKRHEILSTLLSYMHACTTYYHQGEDLCDDLQPFFKKLANEIATMRDETHRVEKDVEKSHGLVSRLEIATAVVPSDSKSAKLEGYLFKKTSNAFKTWNRRWFYLLDNKLVYRKRSGEEQETIMENDLRLCTVKPVTEGERRYCFEIVSPSKSHILQADSEDMYHLWIEALQKGIGAALQRVQSIETQNNVEQINHSDIPYISKAENNNKIHKIKMWEQILRIPGNNFCADCGCPKPSWASINLGILLCIECSGVHRSLGVHYSKVRSLTLDDWEPEVIKVMSELGNTLVNKIYEANVPDGTVKASEHCPGTIREDWIRCKYVEKTFVKTFCQFKQELKQKKYKTATTKELSDNKPININQSLESQFTNSNENIDLQSTSSFDISGDTTDEEEIEYAEDDIGDILYKASNSHNISAMCQALALGADPNWPNPVRKNMRPLHAAVLSGSVIACAYLLLNGAKINLQDLNGRTPLHLSTEEGHTAQVCLFLKNRANQHIEDEEGKLPLSIAEQKEHADIVTLLRLGRLNEEMKDTESGVSGDDMFMDVVRDFSRLACSDPEKLMNPRDQDAG